MNASGGYRKTHSFALVCLIYHATSIFCRRNFDRRNDALGKTVGQMLGAARSARQNIVEGSSRAATSRAQEARQYDVAKGSLDELAGDYEAFIIEANESPWSIADSRAEEVASLTVDDFELGDDVAHRYGEFILAMRKRFGAHLESEDAMIAAQSILITIRRAAGMLTRQIQLIQNEDSSLNTPPCPLCGARMRKVTAKNGPNAGNQFWSCSRYPACKGSLPVQGRD